jgi:glycosyltransferase involved in cell wall biosynthesis
MDSDVSIIITNYNYGKYIGRCLRSCLSQRYHLPQVIVVDDCSTDDSDNYIRPFLDHIVYIKNKNNVGIGESSNIGIRKAEGQFVIRVDADDFINEDMIFFLWTYLTNNLDAFCVSSDYIMVDEYENKIERKYADSDPISCGIMYRKDLFLEMGGYNSNMRHREEEELRKRLGDKYKIHHLKIPFYRYRMHKSNKTKTVEYQDWKIE